MAMGMGAYLCLVIFVLGFALHPAEASTGHVIEGRVVGGSEVKPFQYPWMVALLYKKRGTTDSSRFICGGSLIHKDYVMSAGHCVIDKAENYQVILHRHNLSNPNEPGAERHEVEAVYRDPRYIDSIVDFDFSLFKLKTSSKVAPVRLMRREDAYMVIPGMLTTTMGWGRLQYEGLLPETLQRVSVPIVSNQYCADAYKGHDDVVITSTMICAGYPEGGKDACNGDSGGPIFINLPCGPMHIGVVSSGYGCAYPNYPGTYGYTLSSLEFLDAIMNGAKYITRDRYSFKYDQSTKFLTITFETIDLGTNKAVSHVKVSGTSARFENGAWGLVSKVNGYSNADGVFREIVPVTIKGKYRFCIDQLTVSRYKHALVEPCRITYLR